MIEDCKRELSKLNNFQRRLFYLRFVAIDEFTGRAWRSEQIGNVLGNVAPRTVTSRLSDMYRDLEGVERAEDVDDEWIQAFLELAGNPISPDIYPSNIGWTYEPEEEPEDEETEFVEPIVEQEVEEPSLTIQEFIEQTRLPEEMEIEVEPQPEPDPPLEPIVITPDDLMPEFEEVVPEVRPPEEDESEPLPPPIRWEESPIDEDQIFEPLPPFEPPPQPISWGEFMQDAGQTIEPPLPPEPPEDGPRSPIPWELIAGGFFVLICIGFIIVAGVIAYGTSGGSEQGFNEELTKQAQTPKVFKTPQSVTLPGEDLPTLPEGVELSLFEDNIAGENGQILLEVIASGEEISAEARLNRAAKSFQGQWRVDQQHLGEIKSNELISGDPERYRKIQNREFETGDYVITLPHPSWDGNRYYHFGLDDIYIPKLPFHTTFVVVNLGTLEVGVLEDGVVRQGARIRAFRQTTDITGSETPEERYGEFSSSAESETDATGIAKMYLAAGTYMFCVEEYDGCWWPRKESSQWYDNIDINPGKVARMDVVIRGYD